MDDELCKRNAYFINQCLNSDCALVNQLVKHGIYFECTRSPVGRNALRCCKEHHASDIQRVNKTDELLSEVLVSLE
jgi:hypothetical protein